VLSFGVGSFDDGSDVEELGFVRARVDEVKEAFERLNAEVETFLDRSEGDIENLLRQRLVGASEPADVVVVHLIGHGRADRAHRLSFIARDNREVDVDRWIEKAQQEVERGGHTHRVVFLVDTCSAGTATGRQPFTELDGDRGVWALGASVSHSPTEQGRFSSWLAAALHRLADRDFNLDEEAITFRRFVRELIRVIRKDPTAHRLSLGFSVEQGDADWPFLPNPRTATLTAEQLRLQRRSLGSIPGENDPGLQAAAGQPVDDTRYFADRASGRGLVPTDTSVGFFSGRAAELARYAEWVAGEGRLLTVTGAAGAGKSGLLGVIVCAADPGLRRRFRELWESAGHDIPAVPGTIALHARQRSAQQLIDAIVALADLPWPTDPCTEDDATADSGASDESAWTAPLLRTALEREKKDRLIVLDAVDESIAPQGVLRLVADLLRPSHTDGEVTPAPCRILLGGRREVVTALSALEQPVGLSSECIDLDTADPAQVEEDVRGYIQGLLTGSEPYATGACSEFVELLAKKGAQHIVRGQRPGALWGPFLLAGLYVHYLRTLKHPPQDEVGADAYAKTASADLPSLLEAILKARRHDFPSLRAVLAVLARSRGDGMPLTTLKRCAKALDADSTDDEHFRDTLEEASPFLRYGSDPQSGETLYRLFHQGLVDYLRAHPLSEDPLDAEQSLDLERRLLAEIISPFASGPGERTDPWEAAEDEPYVLRHALGHVATADSATHAEALLTDAYFLVRFDLREDHRAIDLTQSEEAAAYQRLLSASWAAHARLRTACDRASVFAFDADRLGLPELRERFARIARETALGPEATTHRLLWSRGGRVDTSSRFIESASIMVHNLAFSPDGSLLAAATHSGVQVVETETWRSVTPVFGDSPLHWVTDVAFAPDGHHIAFANNSFSRSVQLWDVENRVFAGQAWQGRTGTVNALAYSPDGRLLAVGSEELGVSVWDVAGDRPLELERREPVDGFEDIGKVRDVAFSPDGRFLAVASSAGLALWEPESGKWSSVTESHTVSVAFSCDGRLLGTASDDGIALFCMEKRTPVTRVDVSPNSGHKVAISSDGALLAVSCFGSLCVADVESGRVINRFAVSGPLPPAVAFHPTNPSLLVSGGSDGKLRLWKGFSEATETVELPRFDGQGVIGSPDGRFLAVLDRQERLLALLDPATGDELASRSLKDSVDQLAFSPDGQVLAAVSSGSSLHVLHTGSLPLPEIQTVRLSGGPTAGAPLAFSPDSRYLGVLVQEDRDISALTVWESRTLRPAARIPLPGQPSSFGFAGPHRVFAVVDGAIGTYVCTPGPEVPPA
jgi:WD40 repeat protein